MGETPSLKLAALCQQKRRDKTNKNSCSYKVGGGGGGGGRFISRYLAELLMYEVYIGIENENLYGPPLKHCVCSDSRSVRCIFSGQWFSMDSRSRVMDNR